MSVFDAELYLRLAGERALLGEHDHNGGPQDSPLTAAARALVAADAIATSQAQQVLDDYELALMLRGQERMRHRMMRRQATRRHQRPPEQQAATPLQSRRIVSCDRVIEQPDGTMHVRHVILGEDLTKIAVTFRSTQTSAPRRRRGSARMMMMGGPGPGRGGPPRVTLTDDRGASTQAHFSGGGSDSELRGSLQADQPLAEDTRWIELDGQRIELVGEQPEIEVSIEQLADDDLARRHLWRLAASPNRFMGSAALLTPARDALVAAGALPADDPIFEDVRTVLVAMHGGGPAPASGAGKLPEPWRSLLARRGVETGPTGTIGIGAVTPTFDGMRVALLSLEATEDGFELEVEATPGLGGGVFSEASLERDQLVWWASDDRDNHYLGHLNGWSGSDGYATGSIEFWPALDPAATQLAVMPTAERSRAVIRLALSWPEPTEQDT
jgi:hypothetical protein